MSDADFARAKQAFVDALAALQAGRFAQAELGFLASLEALPGRISSLVNLAATQVQLNKHDAVLATTDTILAAEPDNAEAWLHRGTALGRMDRFADALEAFDRLVAIAPALAVAWLRRGETLERLSRADDALADLDRALALDPAFAAAWSRRGSLLRERGRLPEAAEAYRQAIAHGADDALHRYYLASTLGDTVSAPPREYVERLFDGYAGEFDHHLVDVLKYRAPAVLMDRLDTLHPPRFASALDLGCGTGLCGPLLKPRADRLTGVDLSQPMLDRARALGVYDTLVQADIVEHLRTTDLRHDLVVAADVFIYVGDLEPVFAALARVMLQGGVFCFTAERPQDVGAAEVDGFVLQPSLRYAHAQRYLLRLAHRHGFDVRDLHEDTVREDQRRGIPGLFVCLMRNAQDAT